MISGSIILVLHREGGTSSLYDLTGSIWNSKLIFTDDGSILEKLS